jgi:hypothetical protein
MSTKECGSFWYNTRFKANFCSESQKKRLAALEVDNGKKEKPLSWIGYCCNRRMGKDGVFYSMQTSLKDGGQSDKYMLPQD